jgi:2-polyprenyl-3-methyl-5-hydroxy-6-metoxy-1,4-benzoquinol methylase
MVQDAIDFARSKVSSDYERAEFKLNERRYIETLTFLVKEVSVPSQVLEIGCSPGVFTLALSQLGYTLYGVDANPNNCNKEVLKRSIIKKCDLDFEKFLFRMTILT